MKILEDDATNRMLSNYIEKVLNQTFPTDTENEKIKRFFKIEKNSFFYL